MRRSRVGLTLTATSAYEPLAAPAQVAYESTLNTAAIIEEELPGWWKNLYMGNDILFRFAHRDTASLASLDAVLETVRETQWLGTALTLGRTGGEQCIQQHVSVLRGGVHVARGLQGPGMLAPFPTVLPRPAAVCGCGRRLQLRASQPPLLLDAHCDHACRRTSALRQWRRSSSQVSASVCQQPPHGVGVGQRPMPSPARVG